MKAAIINKINKIKGRRPTARELIRPSIQISPPEQTPREKERSDKTPSKNVIIIDLM